MRKSLLLLLLGFFLFGGVSENMFAQNPKQTKKYKKKNKKKKKPDPNGIEYVPRKKRDDDGDGVPNRWDHCPQTPKGEQVTGIGCPPDTDGDGIYDKEDDCPQVKGPFNNNGCPELDTDGDGILDRNDRCPDVPGVARFQGCPDTDEDGIEDHLDKCPNDYGLVALDGCPRQDEDSDGDGLYNYEDDCPFAPGPKDNRGCPKFTAAELRILKAAFDNLLFAPNSYVIDQSSYESLNNLAMLMEKYSKSKLYLEGHTDNVGDDDTNMLLSQNRARSVKAYLEQAGIQPERITTAGYGETRPVESNATSEGRKKNRRVMMDLGF
jgi:outer membrane protein OmpA-like peptidoglycan-associated protein